MRNLWIHPWSLRGLYALAMARAFLRYRNPRRRRAGRTHVAFYERMWVEAADEIGATCVPLASGMAEIRLDGRRTRVFENVSAIDDPVTLAVLHDKPLTSRILRAEGIRVPEHVTFDLRDLAPAVAFIESRAGDCVVKPASGTGGGRGVTTGIRRRSHLARAAAAAAVYADDLLIEEQLPGDNYRLLYLDGELIDAYVRRFPSVVGDGRSSVRRLVHQSNEDRLRSGGGISQVLLTVDLDMRRTLARQGLSLRSVPPAGSAVTLKTVVNENAGTDNRTATHLLCPSVVEDGARAVRALGARFAGVDVITPDPGVPLADSGGGVIEVNGTPNLYFHYQKADGRFPAAVHLLGRLVGAPPRPAGDVDGHPAAAEPEFSHAS